MQGYINYFEMCKNKYNDVKTIVQDIVRYEYSDYAMYSILPCYFYRGFVTKGKSLESDTGLYVYGFDDRDKLIYVKYGTEERFLLYKDYEVTLYAYGKSLENEKTDKVELLYVQRVKQDEEGFLTEAVEVNLWECVMQETYDYVNGKLVAINNPINFQYGNGNDILKIVYDKDGNVEEIYDDESILPKKLVYKSITDDEASNLRTTLIEKLYENIKNDFKEKSSEYEGESGYMEIQVREEPHAILSDLCVVIGSDEDVEEMLDIYDEELRAKCNVLVQYYMAESYPRCYEECQSIVNEVRARLNNVDWKEELNSLKKIEFKDILYYD